MYYIKNVLKFNSIKIETKDKYGKNWQAYLENVEHVFGLPNQERHVGRLAIEQNIK